MGVLCSFVDNTSYGTEDINDIARSLVGAGIAPFVSKNSYTVSDINALTKALAGSGVQLNGCKCSCTVSSGTRRITVNEGIMFFENGVRLEVDSSGYSLSTQATAPGYVYGYFDEALQIGQILFSKEVPKSGCVVELAYIDSSNNVSDRRLFARSKIGTLGSNITLELDFIPKSYMDGDEPYATTTVNAVVHSRYSLGTVNVDLSKFNYVLIIMSGAKEVAAAFSLEKGLLFGDWYYNGSVTYGLEMVNGTLTFYASTPSYEHNINRYCPMIQMIFV